MNVLADEGVDGPVVERLRHDGHVVLYIAETAPGISDEEILRKANANMSLLVTPTKTLARWCFGITCSVQVDMNRHIKPAA